MGCIGNFLWFIFGGIWQGLSWIIVGCLWCLTIVGIPIGKQCFKLASMAFFPFGKTIVYDMGPVSAVANVLWIIFGGIPLALSAIINGILLCITVIGIPFGMMCFRFARLAFMPFGARVINN